jgi:hypothetical protein
METLSNNGHHRGKARQLILMAVIPVFIYLAIFFVVTYPLMLQMSTHFFTDEKDGLVMIWNVWWTNTAVTQLHQSPWHTNYLYHPFGVTLLAHTLSPFNGFLAIVLLPFLTLKQAYNLIVIFTFVVTGLTTFWLAFYIVRSYWPSIVAGFIFSFSNYHFAHTPGHLNLASLEWIPLFVLCWYMLMRSPGVLVALASAVSLFAVMLCDYYYFFYSFVIAVMLFIWRALQRRNFLFFLTRRYIVSLSVFVGASLVTSGVIMLKLLRLIHSASLNGAHDPCEFPADLLSPFIYGACLRFSHLTKDFWMNLHGNTSENSVYMGVSVLILIAYAWSRRRQIETQSFRLWYVLLLLFWLTSLGPRLHVWGKHVPFGLMPYRLLDGVFPWLEVSGIPSRMMVIVMLCAALIGSMGLDLLLRSSRKGRLVAMALVALLIVEFLPQRMPTFKGEIPDWVWVMRELPDGGGVIDAGGKARRAMYYQTVHNKPLWGGFVARVPERVLEKNERIDECVRTQDFERLRDDYGFRYAVSGVGHIYDLSRGEVIYRQR